MTKQRETRASEKNPNCRVLGPWPLRSQLPWMIVAAALAGAVFQSARADWCHTIGFSSPDVVVVENEPFARIRLYRSSDTNLVQTVDYLTFGGKPGVDYVPSSGTATFAVGQEATNVDISLIDNGLLDGFRDFRIVLTNGSPGLLLTAADFPWVVIEDNEIGSAVDPLFVPNRAAGQFYSYDYKYVDGANRMAFSDPAQYIHWSPMLEQADGRLVAAGMDINGYGAVVQWNADGSHARNLALIRGLPGICSYSGLTLALTQDGQILVGGNIFSVDVFPRRGLARLFTNPPERDFRVLTPAEFFRSAGVARIRVVRTGPTTNAASVSFATANDTASAGVDFVPQSGTLEFAPLEVSKEITVPLLAGTGVSLGLSFNLELSNPSAGYTNIAATPVAILPDLRISLRPSADGAITVTLHGTVPGSWYSLETSADLKNWGGITGRNASGSTLVFDSFLPNTSPQFFRALRY
jgi:hypothetical protein